MDDNSIFLSDDYDRSVVGVDGCSGAITYHHIDCIWEKMEELNEEGHDLEDDKFQDTDEFT